MVYNEMLAKKKQAERMAQKGQNKYEYDSDEDIEVSPPVLVSFSGPACEILYFIHLPQFLSLLPKR